MTLQAYKRLFSVDDYHKMVDAGILAPSDRVELIDGEIITMSPINSLHANIVDILSEQLILKLHSKAIIRTQNPITLDDYSEPEPDIAVVKKQAGRYRLQHPQAPEVLLLIEVSDSTLDKDKSIKIPLYANAGIMEYWIVNIPEQQIEIYRQPDGTIYQNKTMFSFQETAICTTLDFEIKVSSLF